MLVAMRDCVKASNVVSFGKSDGFTPLSFKEAFFLATLGGSQGELCTKLLSYYYHHFSHQIANFACWSDHQTSSFTSP